MYLKTKRINGNKLSHIPSTAIKIDSRLNAAFTDDKLNAAKTNFHITNCWHVHYTCAKTLQCSLSRYEGVDEDNRIDVIALHKCRIERVRIFELLKLLNIICVFVYHTVKLFLDVGGVSDCKRSGWPLVVYTPQVIHAVR